MFIFVAMDKLAIKDHALTLTLQLCPKSSVYLPHLSTEDTAHCKNLGCIVVQQCVSIGTIAYFTEQYTDYFTDMSQ